MTIATNTPAVTTTRLWLENVVIGLNLCPFAHRPERLGLIDIVECTATKDVDILEALHDQILRLEQCSAEQLETIIVVLGQALSDFNDYNQFLDYVDGLIDQQGWEGVFQVASFHPDYQFSDTEPDDASNLTNRSPYPLLHILREASLEKALDQYPDSDNIPDTNIERVCALSETEKQQLFPYLFK